MNSASLRVTGYWMLVCWMLVSYLILLSVTAHYYSLLISHYSAFYTSFTFHSSLFTTLTHYSLLTTFLLPTTYLKLLTSEKGRTSTWFDKELTNHRSTNDSGFWFLVSGYWLLVAGNWLLEAGFWLLVTGYWLHTLLSFTTHYSILTTFILHTSYLLLNTSDFRLPTY
ncbi:MAG: hypothetical protein AB9834_22490 [Lentimicrobium sp.]